jgi:carbon monoxide dehydrogenase subunit G
LSDVELTDGIVIETGKNVTIDLAGLDITRTVGDVTANTQVFLNNGTLTIVDSADDDGEISLTYTGDRNPSVTISTIRNYGVLNVEGGTVNCISGKQSISYAIDAISGTVNVSGGKVTGGAQGWSIRMFLASTTSPVTLNVTGGEVGFVWAQLANMNANKGVINVEDDGFVDYVYVDAANGGGCDASNVSVSVKSDNTYWKPDIDETGRIEEVDGYYKTITTVALDIRIVNGKPQIGYAGEGTLVLDAAVTLTGEWTKNISYTAVENDGDDAKTWVTPAEGYFFFKGFITK